MVFYECSFPLGCLNRLGIPPTLLASSNDSNAFAWLIHHLFTTAAPHLALFLHSWLCSSQHLSIPIHAYVSSWKPRSASAFGWQQDMARHGKRRCTKGTETWLPTLLWDLRCSVQMLQGRSSCFAEPQKCGSVHCGAFGEALTLADDTERLRAQQMASHGVAVASGRAKVEKPKRSSELTSHLKASEIFKSMSLVANYVETWEEVSLTQRGVKRPQVWDSMAHLTNDEEDWRRLKKLSKF